MKEKNIVLIIFLFIMCSLCFSCIVSVGANYYVEIYDENDKQIDDIVRLNEFNITLIDDSNSFSYTRVNINLVKGSGKPYYEINFANAGSGSGYDTYRINKYKKRFTEATKLMRFRIEDFRGEYKTKESETLSSYSRELVSLSKIKIKLEKI